MLTSIGIAGEATYPAAGEKLTNLKKIAYLFGHNGCGKTTVSWLRNAPQSPAARNILRLIERLAYIRALDLDRRPRICGVSSGMLSCWVSIGSDEGRGSAFMARLLDSRECIRRSLPETAMGKQSMKLYKPNHRNARFAHLHVGAQRAVQHPLCDLDDLTAAFIPKTTAVIWMPAIMKLYHLPDMGRMTLRWP